jgi:hypothetical protein
MMQTNQTLPTALLAFAASVSIAGAAQPSPPPTLNVPNTSTAPPAGPPIQIEDCKLREIGGPLLAKTGNFVIEFTNEGTVTADLVRFRVAWAADKFAFIRDQGSFSPGITVKHVFKQTRGALISPLFSHPDLRCGVESVHFKDGTQWTNPTSAVSLWTPTPAAMAPEASRILGSGYIGVELQQTADGRFRARLVLPGGPADQGGLKQGDIIDSINGERPSGYQDIVDLITSSPPKTTLKFVVERDGTALNLQITTGSRAVDAPTDGPV